MQYRHRLPLLGLLAAIVSLQACDGDPVDRPSISLVMAVGPAEGVFQAVGDSLATTFNRLPGLRISTRRNFNSATSAEAIQRGEVDLALEGARTSYLAYRRGTASYRTPHTKLRALSVLFPTVVHIATRHDTGIKSVADFRGRRVYVGDVGSPTEGASRAVLESHGLTFRDIQRASDRERVIDDFSAGRLDGIVVFLPMQHALTTAMMRAEGATLVSIEPPMMELIRSRDPLLRPISIPQGTYEIQKDRVLTVGTDVLLVSREDLPDDLVYRLTRMLFDSMADIRRVHPAARSIDPARGPAAPIPLHRGAARYYRERELFR